MTAASARVDPALASFLDQAAGLRLIPTDADGSVDEQRRAAQAAMRPLVAPLTDDRGPELAAAADRTIRGQNGDLRVRVYEPHGRGPFPALVYLHGGAWWLGSIEMADLTCRDRSAGARCVIVSVDYHLAPEHRYPVALEDSYDTLHWVRDHASALNVDRDRIAVGGTSAGANLAAATALAARDWGGPGVVFQLLEVPVLDVRCATESMEAYATGYFLTREAVVASWQLYLGSTSTTDPYASPALAKDLAGLPPTLVVTAECDPLRDEGEAFAHRLEAAGVPTTLKRYPRTIHGFHAFTKVLPAARQCRADVVAALRDALAG